MMCIVGGDWMPSNRKQPIELVKARGKTHYTKEQIAKKQKEEIAISPDGIEIPEYLDEKQKARFNVLVDDLKRLKILDKVDGAILGRYVFTESVVETYMAKWCKTKSLDDKMQLDASIIKYQKMANENARQLGLTISSRCKLVVPEVKEEENPLFKILGS